MSYAKGEYVLRSGPNSLKSIYGNVYPITKRKEWASKIYQIEPLETASGIVYPTPIETNWSPREARWLSTKIIPYQSIEDVQKR